MCEGLCKVQIYDVSVVDVKAKLVEGAKPPCPEKPYGEEIADALQTYSVKIEGCKDAECACIPLPGATHLWTAWTTHAVPANQQVHISRWKPDGTGVTCVYDLAGWYYMSSTITEGNCQKAPHSQERLKNPERPRPEKPAKKAGPGTKNK